VKRSTCSPSIGSATDAQLTAACGPTRPVRRRRQSEISCRRRRSGERLKKPQRTAKADVAPPNGRGSTSDPARAKPHHTMNASSPPHENDAGFLDHPRSLLIGNLRSRQAGHGPQLSRYRKLDPRGATPVSVMSRERLEIYWTHEEL
jgi:hypothetical protein